MTINETILVLANPDEPQLTKLRGLQVPIVAGNSVAAFEHAARDATVLLNWASSRELFRDVFNMCPRVRWVHIRSAGLDNALFPELIASPVPLTNGKGVFSESLAEFTLGAILYFAKDFRRLIRNQISGLWSPFDVISVSGQTVGIIGYGDIGRAIARKVRNMDMKVLALKRNVSSSSKVDPPADQIFGPKSIVEMISSCDYVVVATPLTAETRNLIDKREISAMKNTAVIINVGRGQVINELAMIDALTKGMIKGAALDVFNQEPLPDGHPFYKLENVLLSPHCADHTTEWLDDAMNFFISQFRRFRDGGPLSNFINKQLGY